MNVNVTPTNYKLSKQAMGAVAACVQKALIAAATNSDDESQDLVSLLEELEFQFNASLELECVNPPKLEIVTKKEEE